MLLLLIGWGVPGAVAPVIEIRRLTEATRFQATEGKEFRLLEAARFRMTEEDAAP